MTQNRLNNYFYTIRKRKRMLFMVSKMSYTILQVLKLYIHYFLDTSGRRTLFSSGFLRLNATL